jgi:biopolymer transport protein ExbB
MKRLSFLLLLLALMPSLASAWWNEDWSFKKKVMLDVAKLKHDGVTAPEGAFALIRLHTGNFLSFAELADKGKDIRILAGDEVTPLKFYIEKLDPVNEMALVWVKLSKEVTASPEPALWIYFGHAEAVGGEDAPGSYDVSQVLSYQFDAKEVKDVTANVNNPTEATTTNSEGGLIAGAAVFQGSQIIRVPAKPSLLMAPTTGWTASAWVKIDQAQQNTVLLQRTGPVSSLTLSIKEQTPMLEVTDGSGAKQEFAGLGAIPLGAWHHLAVTATADNLTLYLDGVAAGAFPVKLAELTNEITVGADASGGRGFSGSMDQLAIYKIARDVNAIKFDVLMQGSGSALLTYGDDATPDSEEGGESYVVSTLNNVTVDGWVIIGILGVMCLISWMVMVVKAIVINRTHGENRKFEQAFSKLGTQDIATLNAQADEADDEDLAKSPLLFSLSNHHGTFTGSSIYRIYHVGVEEMNKRFMKAVGADVATPQILTAASMAAVRASMDAVVVRELQKLNAQMVLLTIAISGGPFLGLLGTVVGVMITFAAIAASGEINVNAIAPGIAAALVATVAGLIVAIPALFGYNYLGSRIKIITADMHVFVDEFVAKLAEQHT